MRIRTNVTQDYKLLIALIALSANVIVNLSKRKLLLFNLSQSSVIKLFNWKVYKCQKQERERRSILFGSLSL